MKKLLCLLLALTVVMLSACSKDETEESPEVTATPEPTVEPTATPVPTPEPTAVPVVAFDEYQYFIINNSTLAVSFKYPSHWINEPGKSSIRYTEPVEPGDTPAQLTVTSKYMEDRPRDRDMLTQMESFLALVQNRFRGQGLYFLDEPEAALSPMRQMTLIGEIDRLVREGSQFIIATHSPMLMAFPGAQVLEITEKGIESVDYRRTEHYQVTRRFLEQPERMLGLLLAE